MKDRRKPVTVTDPVPRAVCIAAVFYAAFAFIVLAAGLYVTL